MRGVGAVFALTTPFEAGMDAEVAQGHSIVAAAGDVQVPHLAFSSVASADQHTGVPHFDSSDRSEIIAWCLCNYVDLLDGLWEHELDA
jgi:uncharacterized protein YbjT (DUF2867 family)